MVVNMIEPNLESEGGNVQEQAQDLWSEASDFTERTLDDGMRYARENPLIALAGAVFAGVVIALLLHKREPTVRERYIDGPLEDISDLLTNLREQIGDKADKHFHKTAAQIERAVKQAKKAIS